MINTIIDGMIIIVFLKLKFFKINILEHIINIKIGALIIHNISVMRNVMNIIFSYLFSMVSLVNRYTI